MNYIFKKNGRFFPSDNLKKIAHVSDPNIYKIADKNPIAFWEKIAEKNISWDKKWDKAYEVKHPFFNWLVGGKLNISYNALDRHLERKADNIALIWIPEPAKEKAIKFTYKQLSEQVNKFANVLKSLGIKKGDVVSIYLPLIPEVVISMLACARIGAIHSVVFSAFSSQALKTRIEDGKSKVLITSDGYYRKGEKENLKDKADEAIKGTVIKKTIIVKRTSSKIKLLNNQFFKNALQLLLIVSILFLFYTLQEQLESQKELFMTQEGMQFNH